jgi:hypothetical protein
METSFYRKKKYHPAPKAATHTKKTNKTARAIIKPFDFSGSMLGLKGKDVERGGASTVKAGEGFMA